METTAQRVLDALQQKAHTDVKQQRDGTYRFNNPLRPGSNSHAGKLTLAADGEHGVFYDHVSKETYTLYQFAQQLGVDLPQRDTQTAEPVEAFDSLAAYAARQGVPAEVFSNAGWKLTTHKGRPALVYPVDGDFKRYRYLDGAKPKYMSEAGYSSDVKQWYHLDYAINLALATNQPLVICNGEASTLVAQYYGVAATCVPGGEMHIPDHLIGTLRKQYNGAVRVVFDSDKTGREVAPHVVEQLQAVEYADVAALDLQGGKGFDLANFCKLHGESSVADLQQCKVLGEDDFWQQGVTAYDLMQKHFEPLHWVVDDILPEGCTLLAGKPKARKSWLALNIALAVALGGRAMGFKNANKGDVLYLDLESNQRRAQRRLQSTLRDIAAPKNLHIFTEWPKLDAGGEERLEQWIKRYPNTKLIIVDVFQDLRAAANPKAQLYTDDRAAVEPLRRFASKHHIAILIIHHTRKAKGDDVFDEISGSTGLTGGVDNIMVLSRDGEDNDKASLAIRGRDIEFDNALQLEWDFDFCQWRYKGEDSAAGVPKDRKAVLEQMQPDEVYTPKELAELCGKEAKNVSKMLRLLESTGHVVGVGHGKYKLTTNNNNDDKSRNEGGYGGYSGESRNGGNGGYPPYPPTGYREVEMNGATESQEAPISTISPISTQDTAMLKLDWPLVQREYARNSLNAIRLHCAQVGVPFDTVMDELRGISLPDDFENETL